MFVTVTKFASKNLRNAPPRMRSSFSYPLV